MSPGVEEFAVLPLLDNSLLPLFTNLLKISGVFFVCMCNMQLHCQNGNVNRC